MNRLNFQGAYSQLFSCSEWSERDVSNAEFKIGFACFAEGLQDGLRGFTAVDWDITVYEK